MLFCYTQAMPSAGAVSAQVKEDRVLTPSQISATAVDEPSPTPSGETSKITSDDLLAAILKSLDDDKAEDIVQIDLRGKSSIGDYMVIASGRSSRQVSAIAEKLADRLKQDHGRLCKTEGKETGDWVLVDTGDIIVHIFRPEVREFYQLEKMWLPQGQA